MTTISFIYCSIVNNPSALPVMEVMSFKEYIRLRGVREGVLLPDRPPLKGTPRINPFPISQKRLQRLLAGPRTSGEPLPARP